MAEPTLFDEASLALIASGGAGKDGKVYSIKPVPEYGPEKVTNGDFATDSNWTKGNGATISGGKANIIGDGSTYVSITQNSVFTTGRKYRVSADVEINSGLGLKFQDGATNENIGFATSSGTYVFDFIAGSNTSLVVGRRTGNTAFNSSVDNISVKEISNDGDFTFSRGSNLSATRVGPDGLIEKGRENLLTKSNQFEGWNLQNVTSGHAGYDGTNDAWLQSGTSRLQRNISLGTSVYTGSVYVKAGFSEFVQLYLVGSSNALARFELTGNGTIVNSGGISPKIEPVSGATGWYRISTSINASITTFRIYPQNNSSGTQTADSSIYIQDAQLEIGLAATEVIESGATTGKAGLLEDEPRFDYSGGATCPSLLLEPSRTNLAPISEGVPEGTNNVTLTENYATSPEGVQNSLKVQKNGVDSNDRIQPIGNYNATLVSGKDYTISCFVKNIDATNAVTTLACRVSGGSLFRSGYEWDGSSLSYLTTGYNSGTRENIFVEDYGNDWWRIGFTFEADGTSANFELDIDRRNGSGSNTTSIETWGWQLESATSGASYATSYIPTYGSSQTRAQENCSNTSIPLLSQTSGTYFLDITPIDTLSNNFIDVRALGSMSNRLLLQAGGANLRILVRAQNTTILDSNIGNVLLNETKVKIAVRYTPTNISVFIDGIEKINNSVTLDFNPELNWIDLEGTSTSNDNALKHHQFLFFSTALSDTELIKLTTI